MRSLILTIFLALGLWSCVAKKEVSKTEIKKDSVYITNEKIKIDTIYNEKIKTIFEKINNEITIPCDSAKFSQSIEVGKIKYKIIKEKGSVRVVFRRDSSSFKQTNEYKSIYKQNDSLKRLISTREKTEKKEVVKKPFFANLWQILFFIVLFLWIFGITPRFIFKLITNL
jgi:hypothetical protein